MTKAKSRPSSLRIFSDNFRWTWRHRKFQYKWGLIGIAVGIPLSLHTALSAQGPDLVSFIGAGLAIIGLVTFWMDHSEIKGEADQFSILPLMSDTHERVVVLSAHYGYEAGLFENRTVFFPTIANGFIRAGGLDTLEYSVNPKPFVIKKKEHCRRAFEHFRRQAKVVWNDEKLRLNSDPSQFTNAKAIQLQRTNYFDYLATGFYSQRVWKFQNTQEYDGLEFMHDGTCLLPLWRSDTAHHIGVSTLLLTSNKRLLVQRTQAKGGVGRYVPSGSGSLDSADLGQGFGLSLLNGAKREFREETGWDELAEYKSHMQKVDQMEHYPLGMAIDVSRGLVTDFYFLSVATADTHKEYDDSYSAGKVVVDTFEIPLHNAITWLDCSKCDTPERWDEKLHDLVASYQQADPILAINLKLFRDLLRDITHRPDGSKHPKHGLLDTLLGKPHHAYTGA